MMEQRKTVIRTILVNSLKALGILAACTLVAYIFVWFGLRTENISMVYLVGVLLITLVTKKLVYGIVTSVISVFAYNFFFTAPKLTFRVSDPNYIVTLAILLAGSFIVSVLTNQLQEHISTARQKEKQMSALYEISTSFLNISGIENIVTHGMHGLAKVQSRQCIIYMGSDLSGAAYYMREDGVEQNGIRDNDAAKWCYENVKTCGCGTDYFSDSAWMYVPVRSGSNVFGVAGVYCAAQAVDVEGMILIKMVVSQTAEALEREMLYQQQQEDKVKIEKEQLRNSLLRAISHDLRTPLTGIAGSASFIADSFDSISREQMLSLVNGIGNDAMWLNNMVENLLNMTRISEGELVLKKQPEVVDDIVSEAYARISRIRMDKNIRINMPDEVIEVPMDGRLVIQVLVNLLDNALKYTPVKADIDVNLYPENGYMVFEVSDNGTGIDSEILDRVFDNFVTAPTAAADKKRGVGIGLSICRSIVEAHGGVIAAYNNQKGGATFKFALPMS